MLSSALRYYPRTEYITSTPDPEPEDTNGTSEGTIPANAVYPGYGCVFGCSARLI